MVFRFDDPDKMIQFFGLQDCEDLIKACQRKIAKIKGVELTEEEKRLVRLYRKDKAITHLIAAVKLLRQRIPHLGLREAKDAAESFKE